MKRSQKTSNAKATFAPANGTNDYNQSFPGLPSWYSTPMANICVYSHSTHQPIRTLASESVKKLLCQDHAYRVRKERKLPELMVETEANKSSSLTQVVVFVLWSMKKGRPFGAILISQPGGRKLCVTLCCGLGEL